MVNLQNIPTTGLYLFVAELAGQHGITYVRTGSSALAELITSLSGDDVIPDETENLVIALRRANVIDGKTMVTLLGRHFDETRHLKRRSFAAIKRRRPTLKEVFEENAQEEGDRQISDDQKLEKPYKLAELIAEMPAGKLPMVDGWDSLKPVGREVW